MPEVINPMRLSFFGLGHVGLVYAVGFSSLGFRVKGFDIDSGRIRALRAGELPMSEPRLKELMASGIKGGTLTFTEDYNDAVRSSDASFITVNTPLNEEGELDLSQIVSSCSMVGEALREAKGFHLVAVKSTVPPGTTGGVVKEVLEERSGKNAFVDFGLTANPEFMREANAFHDFFEADRIVIGVEDEKSRKIMEEIYSQFNSPKVITNFNNAEMIKYASNSFLSMKISFANMVANICQQIPGADSEVVARGMGLDRRITPHLLRPSLGWGGSCWPKDNRVLLRLAEKFGVEAPLIEASLRLNDRQPVQAIKIAEEVLGPLGGRKIAVLGLAFKADTDDVRGAISRKVVALLLERGARVAAYDPLATKNFKDLGEFEGKAIDYAESALGCISGAECAIIVTDCREFDDILQEDYQRLMKSPFIIDGMKIYEPERYSKVNYRAIGLGPRKP